KRSSTSRSRLPTTSAAWRAPLTPNNRALKTIIRMGSPGQNGLSGRQLTRFVIRPRRHLQALLYGRTGIQRGHPALQMFQPLDRDAGPLVHPNPWVGGDIGDAVVTGEVLDLSQTRIEHLVQAPGFVLIAVDRALQFFRKITEENVGLALHRANSAHLEHQPLQYQRAPLHVLGHQLPGLFRQIDKNRARFEYREVAIVTVNDGRNPAVR